MIRALLIDDENHCVESLSMDLKRYCPDVEVEAKLTSSKDGLRAIKKCKPNLVFLDIEMPWMNGFELLEMLQPIDFEVIFVTAYDSYAINAFKVNAIDYLMKPIDKNDLIAAVEKVKNKLEKNIGSVDKIQNLLEHYFQGNNQKKIILSEKDKHNIVDPNKIIYVQAESNYSKVFFENAPPLLLSCTLKSIEDKLLEFGFTRIHHSYLVNMDKVVQYVKTDGGYLVMVDNSMIPISRSRKNSLKQILDNDFL